MQVSLITMSETGEPVISSLLLAEGLGIAHRALIATIKKHVKYVERFGRVLFQKAPLKTNGGSQRVTCIDLNENQALFVGSLSNNTEQVVEFKATLVAEFDKARKMLIEKSNPLAQKMQALIGLNNDLTQWMIALQQGVSGIEKKQDQIFETKAQATTKEAHELEVRRTRVLSMIHMKLRCAPNLKWKDFFETFLFTYKVDLRELQREPGEHPIDAAIRHGYLIHLEELLDY